MRSGSLTLTELADRLAIRDLSDAFGHCLDHGDCERFLSLFTNDVHYKSGARLLNGHAELRDFFEARSSSGRLSRHFYSGLQIAFTGEGATGSSVWITFAGDCPAPAEGTSPFAVADVTDRYVREEDGWRIAERTISQVFVNSALPPVGGRP